MSAQLALTAATVVYWMDWRRAQDLWPASRDAVFHRAEWSRTFLSILAHADPRHLLSNSLLFFVFALLLAGYFGPLAFPIAPLAVAPVITALTVYAYSPDANLIGASGMVNAMVGEWLVLYWLTARNLRGRLRTMRALGFALMTLVPETIDPERSDLAHAIGFALGVAIGFPVFWTLKSSLRADETWGAEETPDGPLIGALASSEGSEGKKGAD